VFRCSRNVLVLALVITGTVIATHPARGQGVVSSHSPRPANGLWPSTAAEYFAGYELFLATGLLRDGTARRIPPKEQDIASVQSTRRWVASLQRAPVQGLQLDVMGRLAVVAEQDALARTQFEARLATPGLSVNDRAYTLLLAVRAFGRDGSHSARMRIAGEYLTRLMTLPAQGMPAQFAGLTSMGTAYFLAGEGSPAVSHYQQAFALVPKMTFDERDWMEIHWNFIQMANVLSGQRRGKAVIDSIIGVLRPYTVAPATLLAVDSVYYQSKSQEYTETFANTIKMCGYLGQPAPVIDAQYWFNTPRPALASKAGEGAATKILNDGKIRIMEYGHYGCPGCLASLPVMERIRAVVPSNVEVWYVAIETDLWGATLRTADQAAEHYRKYYVDRKRYGLPIALWIGERKPHLEGGTFTSNSPTFEAYDFLGWPWFVVTDGKGIIRSIQMGMSEQSLLRTMRYLVTEAAQHAVGNSAAGTQ
jgi:hypothetical protein